MGAVLSVIHARLLERAGRAEPGQERFSRRARRTRSLSELVNPLMGMIVLPVSRGRRRRRGSWRAHAEGRARSCEGDRGAQSSLTDPLQGLEMRLTYRTLLVLSAIAEHPGASNRHIADIAEIHDQGQISKLLGRLERLGLIVNAGAGQAKGEANAWGLTPKGEEVEAALSPGPAAESPRRSVSALVCPPARQHAVNEERASLGVARESQTPIADAQAKLLGGREAANVNAPVVCRQLVDRGEHASTHLWVQALHVLVGASREANGPLCVRHASPYLRLISSSGIVGAPAAISSRASWTAVSSSAEISSSSGGADCSRRAIGSSWRVVISGIVVSTTSFTGAAGETGHGS